MDIAQSMVSVGLFLLALVCVPLAVQWIRQRRPGSAQILKGNSRFVSAVSVGVNQRVVTVEVGPEGARVWLTLGVTPQAISCLHSAQAPKPETQTTGNT